MYTLAVFYLVSSCVTHPCSASSHTTPHQHAQQRVGVGPTGDILDIIKSWPAEEQARAHKAIEEIEDQALKDMQVCLYVDTEVGVYMCILAVHTLGLLVVLWPAEGAHNASIRLTRHSGLVCL